MRTREADGRLTWYATRPDIGDARSWYPWAPGVEARTIMLSDAYTWPLRGVRWEVRYADPKLPVLFTAVDQSVSVLIMGMRF